MNKRLRKKQLRETLIKEVNKGTLNESVLEKILMALLSPLIRKEVKKIKNDPDIIAAQQSVKYALDQYVASVERTTEKIKEMEKQHDENSAKFWKDYYKKK